MRWLVESEGKCAAAMPFSFRLSGLYNAPPLPSTLLQNCQNEQAVKIGPGSQIPQQCCMRWLVESEGKCAAAMPFSFRLSGLYNAPPCLLRYFRTVKMSRQ